MSLREKEEWNTPCLTIDLHDEPGLRSSSVLPKQHDLTNFFPKQVNPFYHQGGGRDVSASVVLLIFRSNSHLHSQHTANALHRTLLSLQQDARLWFPSEFSDAPTICMEINNQSCFKGGYELVCDTTITRKRYAKAKTTLRCQCHERPKKSRGEGKKMTQRTKPQDDNVICDMYINIFKDNGTSQYYIRQNGGHNLHHSGHPPIQKELKEAAKRHLSTSAVDEVRNMINNNIEPSIIQEMMNYKHGVKMNKSSIQKMRQAFLMDEFEIDRNNKQTTAQILLKWLDTQADVDYVAYYGSYEQAKDTVKVRKERKKGKRTKVATRKNPPLDKATDSKCPLVAAVDDKETNRTILPDTHGETGVIDVPAPEKSNTALAEDPDICKSLDVHVYELPCHFSPL